MGKLLNGARGWSIWRRACDRGEGTVNCVNFGLKVGQKRVAFGDSE